jgi:tetratricopeptide (TPR) repeat protein
MSGLRLARHPALLPRLWRGGVLGAIIVGLSAATSLRAAQPQRGLTNAPALARAYDAIFDADFTRLPFLLGDACGGGWATGAPGSTPEAAPAYACHVLDLVSRWWQMQRDPLDRALDDAFESTADRVVAAGEAWTSREPMRAEAWFYLGAAYGARVQWRVLRGERLAAARDGKRIKDALERAVGLDPGLQDAYFGIGLYHYYADVAPTAAKMLRWLLLLPGGNRTEGLREMLLARNGGQMLRSEADFQLYTVYVWYEKEPERALALLRGLRERHPHNPVFQQAAAEIEDVHLSDYESSLRSWRALFDDARARRVAWPDATAIRARLGMARQLDRLSESDVAIDHLRVIVAAGTTAPVGTVAQAHLQLGEALQRMGARDEALAAFQAAISATPAGDPLQTAAMARAARRQAPATSVAQAYRLSLEGWRALERGDTAAAAETLERALALQPADQVTRYRKARLLLAQRSERAAIDLLESVIAAPATPPHVYAAACLDAAQALERQGATARAVELYELTVAAFGVDPRAKAAAQRALARLAKPA